jgi:hypothetical protein
LNWCCDGRGCAPDLAQPRKTNKKVDMKNRLLALAALSLITVTSAASAAAITTYTDRGAWRLAAGGGTGDIVEDFTGVYNHLPYDAGEFVVSETGDNGAIIVTAGWLDTGLDDSYGSDTITFTFDRAIKALGFSVTPDGRDLSATISFSTNNLDTGSYYLPSSTSEEFRGFVFSAPTYTFTIDHTAGGGFGVYAHHTIDNVEAFSTPEPSSIALLGLSVVGLALSRRRQG